jgi:hypothetical protein
MGIIGRYIIVTADHNRGPLDKLCGKPMAGGGAGGVLRNGRR